MMEQKLLKLDRWFEEQTALCGRRGQELLADDRGDEAVLERIRANIYDVFRTVLSVAVKTCPNQEEAVGRFFLRRAETIPSAWAASYEKARQHHDPVKLRIEQIKLDTAGEIKEHFLRVWEGAE